MSSSTSREFKQSCPGINGGMVFEDVQKMKKKTGRHSGWNKILNRYAVRRREHGRISCERATGFFSLPRHILRNFLQNAWEPSIPARTEPFFFPPRALASAIHTLTPRHTINRVVLGGIRRTSLSRTNARNIKVFHLAEKQIHYRFFFSSSSFRAREKWGCCWRYKRWIQGISQWKTH